MFKIARLVFSLILISLIVVTFWASLERNVIEGFLQVGNIRWGLATLVDAYAGFITFFLWVYYKENTALARWGWFMAILALGNIAMSTYMLLRLNQSRNMHELLLRKNTSSGEDS